MENITVLWTNFWLFLVGNLSVLSILFSIGKSNHCFKNFWPCIVSNLCLVSILFSNGKSNRFFYNFLAFDCRQSIRCFNSFVKWKTSPSFQRFLVCVVGNQSVVSNLFLNGKSKRCFIIFFALHCKQSIGCFNSFVKSEIWPFLQQFSGLAL